MDIYLICVFCIVNWHVCEQNIRILHAIYQTDTGTLLSFSPQELNLFLLIELYCKRWFAVHKIVDYF